MLDPDTLLHVVRHAPLVSIDLVVVCDRHVLVGRRVNEPARGSWFVPGGRVHKGETREPAFRRIAEAELGPGEWRIEAARLLGVFDHVYDANFCDEPGVSTHYVVSAHEVVVPSRLTQLPSDQHADYRWVDVDAALAGRAGIDVHPNSLAYFPLVD